MKVQLRQVINTLFTYMRGEAVFSDLEHMRRGVHTHSKRVIHSIEVEFNKQASKGIQRVQTTKWSTHRATDPNPVAKTAHIYVDAKTVADMLDFLLDNSFVSFRGTVYQQIQGLPMGTPCAPQLANLYCGAYELDFMLRKASSFLAVPRQVRDPKEFALLTSLFNWSRFIDDLAAIGVPQGIDIQELLYDTRHTGGSDGIYPSQILDTHTGQLVANPMQLNVEGQGYDVHYLDLFIHLSASQNSAHFRTALYDKRTTMPVFKDYVRFPRMETILHTRVKYGTLWSQLHRFARIFSATHGFKLHVISFVRDMLSHGYVFDTIRLDLLRFAPRYYRVYNKGHASKIPSQVGRGIMRDIVRTLARSVTTTSTT
jgi:hypothetical protein